MKKLYRNKKNIRLAEAELQIIEENQVKQV